MTSRSGRVVRWLAAVVAMALASTSAPVRGSHTTFYSIKNLGTFCPEAEQESRWITRPPHNTAGLVARNVAGVWTLAPLYSLT
jgi:hypothetical protein